MARRLTDTYFAKCSFSICLKRRPQRQIEKTSIGVWVIPENEVIPEYIQNNYRKKSKS